jgi:NTE family protein
MKNVGVALGGGGARGLAHILALQTIDESGIRPSALAGTSMGAIVGALYASGLSGAQMREGFIEHTISKSDHLKDIIRKRKDIFKWLQIVSPEVKRGGLLSADGFLRYLLAEIRVETFEELKIPLQIVAMDFWSGQEVIFNKGKLFPAIKASMAIPGVFCPVAYEGRVLVDGGLVNNVPYDILPPRCDCTIAIDVAADRKPGSGQVPGILDSVLGMFDMLIERNVTTKLTLSPPTIYIRPGFSNIRVLDFNKHDEVFSQAAAAMETLRAKLKQVTGGTGAKPGRES